MIFMHDMPSPLILPARMDVNADPTDAGAPAGRQRTSRPRESIFGMLAEDDECLPTLTTSQLHRFDPHGDASLTQRKAMAAGARGSSMTQSTIKAVELLQARLAQPGDHTTFDALVPKVMRGCACGDAHVCAIDYWAAAIRN